MKQAHVISSWYADFRCVGAECPYDCCRNWGIHLTDGEIDYYSDLQHPFAEKIVEGINIENLCFKLKTDGHCAMFRQDGLCDIVVQCGDDALSGTCRQYPRSMRNNFR